MSPITWKLLAGVVLAAGAVALGGAAHHSRAAGEGAREPAQERKKKAEPAAGTSVKGTLAGTDPEKNTVTVTVHTFDRKTGEGTDTNTTFPLAKDAKVLQDDAAAKLADLKKGYPVVVALDGKTAAAVSVDGGTAQGEFRSANADRNTITVIAGRDMARRVYHLLKDTKVTGADGKPVRVADLKPGTRVQLTKSVEDENTAIRVQVLPEPAKRDR
jgi:hypothetical protein